VINGLGATNGDPLDPGNSSTSITNGKGNVIIGYDEGLISPLGNRNGSHNLVVGVGNYYDSYGGIIGGGANLVTKPYALAAGQSNEVNGTFATVAGGALNIADADFGAILGGSQNSASGDTSAVVGGQANTASGVGAVVTGGQSNAATVNYSVVP
jgi:hypothetical protein